MDKKYFFFDIDGTLTDNATKKVVPSARKALQMLEENHHFVAIATGRAHYKARQFMEEINLKNMVCSGGGALVINNQLVHNQPLDLQKAIAICKQADQLGYGVLLMLDDSMDCYAKNDLFRQQVIERQEPTNYIIDPHLDYDKLKQIYKVYVSVPREKEHELTLKNTLGHLRFVEPYLMFQYDKKEEGIIRMMEYLHADIKDVVVFGDDYNDLVMFDERWFSIALGNACEPLKEKANYVSEKNIDDGVYKALKKFGWI